jgi:hypothetical protein
MIMSGFEMHKLYEVTAPNLCWKLQYALIGAAFMSKQQFQLKNGSQPMCNLHAGSCVVSSMSKDNDDGKQHRTNIRATKSSIFDISLLTNTRQASFWPCVIARTECLWWHLCATLAGAVHKLWLNVNKNTTEDSSYDPQIEAFLMTSIYDSAYSSLFQTT